MRVIAVLIVILAACDATPSPTPSEAAASAEDRSGLGGTFLSWEAIDDERGYAIISVHNNTLGAFSAHCTVTVTSDFGDTGTAIMEPSEELLPDEMVYVQVAITVDGGAGAISAGEVTDC